MDIFAEHEAALLREANTPERVAEASERRQLRSAEQHALGVRMGWHDEDGNSLLVEEDDEDEDGEEDADA